MRPVAWLTRQLTSSPARRIHHADACKAIAASHCVHDLSAIGGRPRVKPCDTRKERRDSAVGPPLDSLLVSAEQVCAPPHSHGSLHRVQIHPIFTSSQFPIKP